MFPNYRDQLQAFLEQHMPGHACTVYMGQAYGFGGEEDAFAVMVHDLYDGVVYKGYINVGFDGYDVKSYYLTPMPPWKGKVSYISGGTWGFSRG